MLLKELDPADYKKDDTTARPYLLDLQRGIRLVSKPAASFIDRRVANKLAFLRHPGLPRCLGSLKTEADLTYIFEYLPGKSLDAVFLQEAQIQNPLTWLPWMIQWAGALAYIHQQGEYSILHLDIKPANLLIDSSGQASLIDFGAAVIMDEKGAGFARPDNLALTMNYAAPELIAGQPCPASDIFSLGLVMLVLLTGQSPQKCRKQPLKDLTSSQPAALQMILGKCLHTDPTLRYQDTAELVTALTNLFDQLQKEPILGKKSSEPSLLAEAKQTAKASGQSLPAPLICVWSGAEPACELAAVLAQDQAKSVLVIDADLLNPRADLLLGQARQQKNRPESAGLGLALQAGQQGTLTPPLLASLCSDTAIRGVKLLDSRDLVDEYEYFQLESLHELLRKASLLADLLIVICPRSIFDAFTCLCLLLADQVIVSLAADLASFREANRLLEFMNRQHKLDFSRLAYLAFAYEAKYDLSQGTLGELSQGRLAGVISAQPQRRRIALQAQPYAARLTKLNRREYLRLIRRLGLHQGKGE